MRALIAHNADINLAADDGSTPLAAAAARGFERGMQLMLRIHGTCPCVKVHCTLMASA